MGTDRTVMEAGTFGGEHSLWKGRAEAQADRILLQPSHPSRRLLEQERVEDGGEQRSRTEEDPGTVQRIETTRSGPCAVGAADPDIWV